MPVPDIKSKYSKDELKSKQSDHWLMKQEETDTKAASFEERVSRPRRETHLKKNEEKYQQFSGPVWKGKGYKLEGKNTETVTKRRGKGSSKDAIAMRNLPDSAYPPPMELNEDAAKNKPVVKEKKMIKLPVEPPPESDLQAVTIALRVPFGEKRRRRFLTSATIQVIFDWLTVEGYNSDIYTIKTTYPSKDLSDSKNKTLEELGLSKDVILIVDDKDV
ncbi:UBX domain-containing protein 8-like isoform X2 [Antedon mediterranea]